MRIRLPETKTVDALATTRCKEFNRVLTKRDLSNEHRTVRPNRMANAAEVEFLEPPLAKDWQKRRDTWLQKFLDGMESRGCKVITDDFIPGVYSIEGESCPVAGVAVFMQTVEVRYRVPDKPTLTLDFGARMPLGKGVVK